MNSAYAIHTNFEKIFQEINKVQSADKDSAEKVASFAISLRDLTQKIQPILKMEAYGQFERELWHKYEQLQLDKLLVLELAHEWDFLEGNIEGLNRNVKFLIRNAIEELTNHINVIAETHRAHIDLLEIRNTRRLNILVLIVSTTICLRCFQR